MVSAEVEEVASCIVDTAFRIHRALGPSLREKHYARFLRHSLQRAGRTVSTK